MLFTLPNFLKGKWNCALRRVWGHAVWVTTCPIWPILTNFVSSKQECKQALDFFEDIYVVNNASSAKNTWVPTNPTFFKSLACFYELPLALSNRFDKCDIFKITNGQALDFFEHLLLVNDGPRTRNCCGTNTPHTFLCFRWCTICHLE